MKVPPPPLLPLLRSRTEAELLTRLLLSPDDERSLTELARELGVSLPTVMREADRAEQAGVVRSRKVGNTRLVRGNAGSPIFEPLAELLLRSFGPRQVVAEELANVDGLKRAFIFGSWAARYHGQRGPRPVGDIDVLVLGSPDRDTLYEAASRAEKRLGREVQVIIRDTDWLENGTETFHDTVAERPLVQVLPITEPSYE